MVVSLGDHLSFPHDHGADRGIGSGATESLGRLGEGNPHKALIVAFAGSHVRYSYSERFSRGDAEARRNFPEVRSRNG